MKNIEVLSTRRWKQDCQQFRASLVYMRPCLHVPTPSPHIPIQEKKMFPLMAEAVFDLLIPDSKQVVDPAQWTTDASQLHVPEWAEVRDIWRRLEGTN